jgi:hypothetical protein
LFRINVPVHVKGTIFDGLESIEVQPGQWTDTFVYSISCRDGLPPWDYARAVSTNISTLEKYRRGASLWIQVDSPGKWYVEQVRKALYGLPIAIAVTRKGIEPALYDFSLIPPRFPRPSRQAPEFPNWQPETVSDDALQVLHVLVRIREGYTAEIASLAGFGKWKTRKRLEDLAEQGLTFHNANPPKNWDIQKQYYPFWQLQRKGISLALRSWRVSKGMKFSAYKERRNNPNSRHRRTSRLFMDSMRKSWRGAEIWTGWSEVQIPRERTAPDALAWGRFDGHEALFWLEVEGGGTSGKKIMERSTKRFQKAILYAQSNDVHLVFVLLAKPWAGQAARLAFAGVPENVTVIVADWKKFGKLPVPQWGRVVFV